MRAAVPAAALIALVAIAVVLTGVASTLALARSQVERLDADLTSVLRADYSADPSGIRLAPLSEGIIEVAQRDEGELGETTSSGTEIVPVFNQGGEPEQLEPPDQESAPNQEPPANQVPPPDQEPPPDIPAPAPAPTPELQGALFLDSGEDPSVPGGPPAAGEVLWWLGERLLVRLENLDSQRFPGGDSCEARIQVGPVDESVAIIDGVAELDIQNNVPVLVAGTRAEVRIRCEFQDEGGQRQRHETRWRGTVESVTQSLG